MAIVEADQLEYLDGLMYFEEKLFTGVAVSKWSNGQKYEGTYKDGEFISSKYWDEEGNPTSAPP